MRSFNLLTAILLVAFGSTVWADDPASEDNADLTTVEQPTTLEGEYAPSVMDGAYSDFPGYYPGYSSYRGLGFMGSCCEQDSCCAQDMWNGYCEQKSYGYHSPFHGWADKLRCHLAGSVCCDKGGSQKGCCEEPCVQKAGCEDTCSQKAGCGVKPFNDACSKLHALRNRSGWWNGLGFRSYGEAMPTYTDPVPADTDRQNLEPAPESSPEPPAEVTTDYVPNFPDLTRDDRSAQRTILRRLPKVR